MSDHQTVWSFDLGKASDGEAVRDWDKAIFKHKASLLIPHDLGRRGPATLSGSPANRHRMRQTRLAHTRREDWLDKVWRAAGLIPLARRKVEYIDYRLKKIKRRERGKLRWKTKKTDGRWNLSKADPLLEREFGAANDPICYTSCLLRIKLLHREKLQNWQIFKALFSAIQKRGYANVPWKKDVEEKIKNVGEEEEEAKAGQRWTDFTKLLNHEGLTDSYRRACYFDAWHMKLWNPSHPDQIESNPKERPESTRKVVFPAEVITEEVLALASSAAEQEPQLREAYDKIMSDWRRKVVERIARINTRRAEQGKKLVRVPDFSIGAKDFAELLVFGPGGRSETPKGVRSIASFDPAIRSATGLRPGGPDDAMGALNQEVARFDNRLRADCALIPRLSVCRNLASDALGKIKEDDHERLLPAQVTFLMKLKDLRVEEEKGNAVRTQRGLTAKEIKKIFIQLNPQRKYHLTKREWRKWCVELSVLPVIDPGGTVKVKNITGESEQVKKDDDNTVEHPRSEGRGRFARPALRILKELLLTGEAPSVLREKLINKKVVLYTDTGSGLKKALLIFPNCEDKSVDEQNAKRGLLVSDLQFLQRMRKDGAVTDTWDNLYIPSQQLDRLAQEAGSSMEERSSAIRILIGLQNNPIVRHRLETFWERLKYLESEAPNEGGKGFGTPQHIILEIVRDDSETSWLGGEAASEITRMQKEQRERRERARKMLAEMGQPNGDVLKYLLWEAQGGQCLYGKPSGKAECPYTETALKFTDLAEYRIDHIVPRAKGGPDSFANLILTTDDANSAKGDRTPWQWFRQDRTAEWDTYKNRVLERATKLGSKKVRLLLSAEAEKLVERYTPLAETAWIARLAQTVAGLHFGWANGVDERRKRRVIVVSGGLTGRIRRKYFLNSLLGNDRALDEKITHKLEELAALRSTSLSREERKEKARQLRTELDELNSDSPKVRNDKRHHALDAMVLNFLAAWVNDPNREDEFRFTLLGDNPPYPDKLENKVGELRHRIIALGVGASQASTSEEHLRLQREITGCHDALAVMRQERNVLAVREAFRREIEGNKAANIAPVLPKHLHFPKPRLEATFYRGVWVKTESESQAERATIDNFDQAFVKERIRLVDVPFLDHPHTGLKNYSLAHGLRRIAEIVEHKDYDRKIVRRRIEDFLRSQPSEKQWFLWATGENAPSGIKPKRTQPDEREFNFYRIEEKRTKREVLYDLGVSSQEILEFNRQHAETQIELLVQKPERGRDKPETPLEPDSALQTKLHNLMPQIEAFYIKHPPFLQKPRKESELIKWQQSKEAAKNAWEDFIKETGLDRHKRLYLRTDAVDITKRRYEKAGLSRLLLTKAKRFDPSIAEKKIQAIADTWTRFQLRQFLKHNPTPEQWTAFCATFVQVPRKVMKQFLDEQPQTADEFVAFYRKQAAVSTQSKDIKNRPLSIICKVNQIVGNAHDYVDISKDGSGIYAKGGNQGYLMWKRVESSPNGTANTLYGAQPVRGFLPVNKVKSKLLQETNTSLIDQKPWKTDMLLHLPNSTQSGKKLVPDGHYYFGSISNNTYATLKPLAGGDIFDGISVSSLLANGLCRV